jgi:L-amino acid N-acyltransferase YncA
VSAPDLPDARPPVSPGLRRARLDDALRCRQIYEPYVVGTVVSFEEEPPTVAEMEGRIAASLDTHEWLVLDGPQGVVGFAYGTPHRSRAAYRWACDVSVYLEPGHRRAGLGRTLYDALLPRLHDRGYRTVLAGIALPNPASEGLHRGLGFEPVGVYRRIGWKFGAWHDVLWMQRHLGPADDPLGEPGETIATT